MAIQQNSDSPVPMALALLFCDAIYLDPATGKRSLLGCFSAIASKEFPAAYPSLAIYAALTDGYGKEELTLQLIDVGEERPPVFADKIAMEFQDPRVVFEIQCVKMPVLFPLPGEYRLQLLCRGAIVIERRIIVMNTGAETDHE